MFEDNFNKGYFGVLAMDSQFYNPPGKENELAFTRFGKVAKLLENMQAIGPRSLHSTVPAFSEAITKIHLLVLPEFILDVTRLRASICAQADKSKQYRNKVIAGMATGSIAGAQFLMRFLENH